MVEWPLTLLNACLNHGPAFGGDFQAVGDVESKVMRGFEAGLQLPCLPEIFLDGPLSRQVGRQQACTYVNEFRCIIKTPKTLY